MIEKIEQIRNRKRVFLAWLFFIISPLLLYVVSLANFKKKWAKNIVWAFTAFFGYTIQVPINYTGDAMRYKNHFENYYALHTTITDLFGSFFSNAGHIEIVSDFLSVVVAGFTNSYHFQFLVYGIFFGYFFSRNLDYMYHFMSKELRSASIWITVALSFVIPVWDINGFDFYAAAQVFIFGVLPIINEKSYRRFPFLMLTPLIHFSFYLIIILTLGFLATRQIKGVMVRGGILVLYILSFFVFGIHPDEYSDIASDYLPAFIYDRAVIYLQAAATPQKTSGGNIVLVFNLVYKAVINVLFLITYNLNRSFIEKNDNLNRMFLYCFYLTGIFNILSLIPSVGRFLTITQCLMWITLFLLLNHDDFTGFGQLGKHIGRIRIFLVIFWAFSIARYLFPMLGLGSIVSGPFWVDYFVNSDTVVGNAIDLFQ